MGWMDSLDTPANIFSTSTLLGNVSTILYVFFSTMTILENVFPLIQGPNITKNILGIRPSFMGIVFGVYRIWIGEFGDLKSDTPILWGSIWPNTIISNPIFYFFPRLHRIWNPNTMESRTIVFAVFDLTCRRVPLKVRSHHQA